MYINRALHSRSWGRTSTLSAALERDASTLAVSLFQVIALAHLANHKWKQVFVVVVARRRINDDDWINP